MDDKRIGTGCLFPCHEQSMRKPLRKGKLPFVLVVGGRSIDSNRRMEVAGYYEPVRRGGACSLFGGMLKRNAMLRPPRHGEGEMSQHGRGR
uniref:Uncharacterized protein n=1 Tax=Oryza glumipatula TaxID=40148 RepID=A0A0E0A8R3_9ORYZ